MEEQPPGPLPYETGPWDSRKAIQQTTSRSSHPVPINELPAELLLAIFDIVFDINDPNQPTSSVLQRPPNQLHTVSSVCSHWRMIILDTPRLWSLINFNGPGGLDRTALWLQRAGEALLSVEMNSTRFETLDPQVHIPLQLEPYMKRVSGFTLEAPADIMNSIIGCWLLNGSVSRVASLQLSYPKEGTDRDYCLDSTQGAPERLGQLLESVVTLRLHGVCFDWSLCNFRGLTTLELAFLGYRISPKLDQLVQMLSASPTLQALYLVNVFIDPDRKGAESKAEFSPILLPFLEILELSSLEGKLRPFISLLQPGTCPLEVRLNLYGTGSTSEKEALVSFLSRSNIKKLRIGMYHAYCNQWFAHLPQLEILHLFDQWTPEEAWSAISPIPADRNIPNCPKLHAIKCQRCRSSRTGDLQRLLKSHPIQSFNVCKRFEDNFGFAENRPRIDSFSKWMSKVAPDVAVSIEPDEGDYCYGFIPDTWW